MRLTNIQNLDCGNTSQIESVPQPLDDFRVTAGISGAWYDPANDGEGWLLEILDDDQALVTWFSYDPDGNQAWFLNTGSVAGNTITFDLQIPTGTDFGPTFEANDLSRPAWGTAVFTFDDCNSGTMSYASNLEGYGSGSLGLTRITHISGLDCQ